MSKIVVKILDNNARFDKKLTFWGVGGQSIFFSNRAWLSSNVSFFVADNNCVFGRILIIFCFCSLENGGKMLKNLKTISKTHFSTVKKVEKVLDNEIWFDIKSTFGPPIRYFSQIGLYYWVLFRLSWPIIIVFLTDFWCFSLLFPTKTREKCQKY